MKPNLLGGQNVLVSLLTYRLNRPSRLDVVVLIDPMQPGIHCIKRIIGLPGERVQIENGRVYVNECLLEERYVDRVENTEVDSTHQWLLDSDEYVVLGDYRTDSRDSRSFGPIRGTNIVGKVWIRYWPPKSWGKVV